MTNKRTAYSHRMELTPQSTNTPTRLPQGTPLLWRGWGRPPHHPSTQLPQGTPLLWRGRGRSPHSSPITALERISHSEVYALSVAEALDIVETTLACVVRNVQPDTPIHTDNEQTHIVSQAYTGSYRHLRYEVLELELRVRSAGIGMYRPHIAGIEE